MTKTSVVVSTAVAAVIMFAAAAIFYGQYGSSDLPGAPAETSALVRPHSPVVGPANAPVTIVEFFDPSCEACRAFHPIVKQILDRFSGDVRLVLRYAPFHEGSDEAVRLLEAARAQDKFERVLDALFAMQPAWAVHGAPDLDKAWQAAGMAGLDVEQARRDASGSKVTEVLEQDLADAQATGVQRTPTFFVNGKPLPSFGPQQLLELVESEVQLAKTSKP